MSFFRVPGGARPNCDDLSGYYTGFGGDFPASFCRRPRRPPKAARAGDPQESPASRPTALLSAYFTNDSFTTDLSAPDSVFTKYIPDGTMRPPLSVPFHRTSCEPADATSFTSVFTSRPSSE